MARREVIEIRCDRCGRLETQTKDELLPLVDGKPVSELMLRYKGEKKVYWDLCRKCRRTIDNYIKRVLLVSEDEDKVGQDVSIPAS